MRVKRILMIDEQVIAELREKNVGVELHEISADGIDVIVRSPSRAEWKRFKAMGADDRRRLDAGETLLWDVLLHPKREILDARFDRAPGLAEVFVAKVLEIAGALTETQHRKL